MSKTRTLTQRVAKKYVQKTTLKGGDTRRCLRALVKVGRQTVRIDVKKKRLIQRVFKMEGLDGNKYFRKAEDGYSKAIEVLQDYGIEMDEVVSSHHFSQPEGRINIDLALTNPDDIFSPISITNSMLVITFYQMQSGRFEVIAYLS